MARVSRRDTLGQQLAVLAENSSRTAQWRTQSLHPDHAPSWPQNHVPFSPYDFLAMGRRKTEPSGSLPSARTAWSTGMGGCCQKDRSHKGLRGKHVSEADLLWWVGVRLPRPMVGMLVSWELPCDQSPRRKLWDCTMSSGRGSHRQAETVGMGREGGSYPPHHCCSWQKLERLTQQKECSREQDHPCMTLKIPLRHMFQ